MSIFHINKVSIASIARLLILLVLSTELFASEDHKASVSSGTLYMVQEDGSVLSYGKGNIYLSIERPLEDTVSRVPGLNNIVGIKVGRVHALALDEDGCIWAWGNNRNGQLGFQKDKFVEKPTKYTSLCNVVNFDAGTDSTIVLFKDNTVKFWGSNVTEELRELKFRFQESIELLVAYSIFFAVDYRGEVYAWGDPGSMRGIFGKGSSSSSGSAWKPKKLNVPCSVKDIDVALDVVFVCKSGDVYIYGDNITGTLGTGNTDSYDSIVKHPTLANVDKIMGGIIRIAKLKNGKYLGWGDQILGPVEWSGGGYMLDPIELNPPLGTQNFYSNLSSIFFINKDESVSRLTPKEHWIFPVKYLLEDYSFKTFKYTGLNKE